MKLILASLLLLVSKASAIDNAKSSGLLRGGVVVSQDALLNPCSQQQRTITGNKDCRYLPVQHPMKANGPMQQLDRMDAYGRYNK
eukprot:CAMPEP_0183721266 /NCGR_PEP_ID=MMETSP0737-20130205/13597_1 /TAXON_ID=385413 /ORGANISM="Thalassiosira miniscula, Strain CCMP1093" /LENGTH=84 /DNA_ID=CAMNT_0025951245 /DNA_START=158 /DNA_END=412 /DNA_ORIENTATION=+